jgi:hypothetical protein
MALQSKHKELECSHVKLVDSYATLEIAHAVVLSSVKFLQPLSNTCTCSTVKIEHLFIESCDDLIAKDNDELMQEVEKLKRDLSVLKENGKYNLLKIIVTTWGRSLRRGQPSLDQLPNNTPRPARTRFKRKIDLGISSALSAILMSLTTFVVE